MIRSVEPVVGNVFEYGRNFGASHDPAQSSPIFRNRIEIPCERVRRVVSCRSGVSGRVAAVEYRVGLDAGVDAIVLEVPDENVPYVLKTTGGGPFEAGIFRRHKLQSCDSRPLAGDPSAAFEQLDVKKSFEIQVVGHRRVDVLQVVPIFQPCHYLPIILELLRYLAILETQAA